MTLLIEDYNWQEKHALITAAYPARRCFSPIHFALQGFPTHVENEVELVNFADIMGEVTSRSELMTGYYSAVEAQAILAIADQIMELTKTQFGREVFPLANLLAPIGMWRQIENYSISIGRKLTVMDISAGCGYLDAYLLNAGHRVIVTDVTQSLYLWQNRLLSLHALDEWASRDQVHFPTVDLAFQATHIPWWFFARMYENELPQVDVIVCDAMLGEADAWASAYIINLAGLISPAHFMYRHMGEPRVMSEGDMLGRAAAVGLNVTKVIDAAPIHGPAHHVLSGFLPIAWDKLLPSYRFMDFIGIGK